MDEREEGERERRQDRYRRKRGKIVSLGGKPGGVSGFCKDLAVFHKCREKVVTKVARASE